MCWWRRQPGSLHLVCTCHHSLLSDTFTLEKYYTVLNQTFLLWHMPLIPTLRYIAVDKHFTFFYKKFRLQHVPGVSTLKYFTKEKLLHSNTCHESLLLVSFVLTKTITLLQVPFSQLQHCKYDCYNWTINFYFWVFCYGQKIISLLQVHHCCTKCMYTEYFALLHMSLILNLSCLAKDKNWAKTISMCFSCAT